MIRHDPGVHHRERAREGIVRISLNDVERPVALDRALRVGEDERGSRPDRRRALPCGRQRGPERAEVGPELRVGLEADEPVPAVQAGAGPVWHQIPFGALPDVVDVGAGDRRPAGGEAEPSGGGAGGRMPR